MNVGMGLHPVLFHNLLGLHGQYFAGKSVVFVIGGPLRSNNSFCLPNEIWLITCNDVGITSSGVVLWELHCSDNFSYGRWRLGPKGPCINIAEGALVHDLSTPSMYPGRFAHLINARHSCLWFCVTRSWQSNGMRIPVRIPPACKLV